ncbi:MAG: hypothetical protein MJB14_22030, partial [Spirochaetes bacterium]|nr:hypothetical protein [Spirochaetota bacterium]
MIRQMLILLRILLNKKITSVPLQVFRKLKEQGINRLPSHVDKKIKHHYPVLSFFQLLREWLSGEMFSRHQNQWILNSFFPP